MEKEEEEDDDKLDNACADKDANANAEDDEDGGDGNNDSGGDCSNWENGDSNGGDVPEFLFSVSGERKVPACTMNATEDGATDQQE